MKRIFLIFFTTFIAFNIAAIISILKRQGWSVDFDLALKIHYEVSVYALKCGVIGVVVDWISRDWFKKDD
ncbi:hypothetical protein [[Mannheimia] succiniciproducens]|uniref:hypothetical protein n=1 Tax=[Mannheimia] succiniciproducens TaxID=157673 RepID=UPI0005A1881C|nr:hypothetical protein [[Mannheimia] succiniciproducens]